MLTIHLIVTWFYIATAELRSGFPLCCSLGSPGYEGVTLLKVGEVLIAGNFKFPVFLLKGYDEESIV